MVDFQKLGEFAPKVADVLAKEMASTALPMVEESGFSLAVGGVSVARTFTTTDGHRLRFEFSIADVTKEDDDGDEP